MKKLHLFVFSIVGIIVTGFAVFMLISKKNKKKLNTSCTRCSGNGYIWSANHKSAEANLIDCPTCSGTGLNDEKR